MAETLPSSRKRRRLEGMLQDERYADCSVLVGQGDDTETFRVNRFALAQCSDVFGKMLFETPMRERSGEVTLRDTTPAAFREFLRCAHGLTPVISADNFVEVVKFAHMFVVPDLLELGDTWAKDVVSSPAKALELLDGAEAFIDSAIEENIGNILRECRDMLLARIEEVFTEKAFLNCGSPILQRLLAADELACDEEQLWSALVKRSMKNPDKPLKEMVRLVRFNVMSPAFFVDEVIPTGALEPALAIEILSSFATKRPFKTLLKGPRAVTRRWSVASDSTLRLTDHSRTLSWSGGSALFGRSFASAFGLPAIGGSFRGDIKLRVDEFRTGSSAYDSFVMIGVAASSVVDESEICPGEGNPNTSFLASFGSPSYHFNDRFPGAPPHLQAGSVVQIHIDMERHEVSYSLDSWQSSPLPLPPNEPELRVFACFLAYTNACSAVVSFVS